MKRARWVWVLGSVGVFAITGIVVLKRRETAELRDELQIWREQGARLDAVRAENEGLRNAQISREELERLRADHAALPRLREEIEALRRRIDGSGR